MDFGTDHLTKEMKVLIRMCTTCTIWFKNKNGINRPNQKCLIMQEVKVAEK